MKTTLKRLLIVDDSAEDREYARHLLQKNENSTWDFCEASSGKEGLELAASHGPFDCILLDYHLPDLTGIEFISMSQERLGQPGMATVLLTGSGDREVAVRAMKGGANDFISKEGLSPQSLFHAVENAMEHFQIQLARHRSLQQLRLANEELKRSNEDLEHFAYAASHDLKSPLRTMGLFAELLVDKFGNSDPETVRISQSIQANARRAAELIEDLLAHARLGSPDDAAAAVPGQISHLEAGVSSVLATLDDVLRETGAEIVYDSLPSVVVPRAHLERVLQNLIENAIKYRRPTLTPRIEISARKEAGHWVIAVQDNGQGFQPEFVEVIFQPFKRLHGPEYSGSGIGLATCRKIVERNGGKIWAESTPNSGSTFYFSLPAATRMASS